MKPLIIALSLYIFVCCSTRATEAFNVNKIVLPRPAHENTPTNYYLEEVLTKALSAVDIPISIEYSQEPMNEKQAIKSLIKGELINLVWLASNNENDKHLKAIEICLYKGLHGVRLFIINEKQQAVFSKVNTLADLQPLIAVQHQSWFDYDVLNYNGLQVNGSLEYSAMFKAVANGLADYYPRSAMTIRAELINNHIPELVVEKSLALKYRNNFYFYVNKDDTALAELLTRGMNIIVNNGTFDAIFDKYHGKKVDGLALDSRKVFTLKLPEYNVK